MANPTSIRLTDDEHELVAAHQARLKERTGRDHSVTDVVRYLLGYCRPPEGKVGPIESRFRRAYKKVFG